MRIIKKLENKKAITLIALVITIVILIVLIASTTMILLITNDNNKINRQNENKIENIKEDKTDKLEKKEKTSGITVVPTMNDKITLDSSWCGTFQLVWNDMKNEIVKQDVVFNPQLEVVRNLNKEDFNTSMISDDYYYKIYGVKSLKLKKQIEDGIKEKFNQTSDILDDFDWPNDEQLKEQITSDSINYFFYTMLYRKFEFLKEFSKLENDKFADKYNNIEYFGINSTTDKSVRNQITVLYYNSKDDFALLINTKTNDEVIFCKNPEGKTFKEIYDNMITKQNKYSGDTEFNIIDEFKAPKLKFDKKREFDELANKPFLTADGRIAVIEKAIQTIKFSLDEKGGEIKSEAAIDVKVTSLAPGFMQEEEPRHFYVDNTFAIFLREKGRTLPYFAGCIDDITKFQ